MAEWGPQYIDIAPAEPDGLTPVDDECQSEWIGDDLNWILEKFAKRVMADGALLTLDVEGQPPEPLAKISRSKNPVPLREVVALLEAAHDSGRRSQTSGVRWLKRPSDGDNLSALTMVIAEDGELSLHVTATFGRSNRVQRFASEQVAAKLMPVLSGYFRLWLYTRRQQRKLDALQAALNLSDVATVILDSNGAVVGENASASLMFQQNDVLRKSRHALSAVCRGETPRLHSAMDAVMGQGAQWAPFSLSRKGYGRPLMSVVSATDKPPEISSDPSFILCIYDPEKDIGRSLKFCCEAYRLTKTEAKLVEHLVSGITLGEAAARMRIAEATARSYLKQIFAKTETTRQSDLIRVMLLSIARTSDSLAIQ